MKHPVLAALAERENTSRSTAVSSFDEYRRIYVAYVSLLQDSTAADEALKRALFIGWYAVVEPNWLSGVRDIDTDAERTVFDVLDRRARQRTIDFEFDWMLGWYFEVAAFYFERPSTPTLLSYLSSLRSAGPPAGATPDDFRARGQMGLYWAAVLAK